MSLCLLCDIIPSNAKSGQRQRIGQRQQIEMQRPARAGRFVCALLGIVADIFPVLAPAGDGATLSSLATAVLPHGPPPIT